MRDRRQTESRCSRFVICHPRSSYPRFLLRFLAAKLIWRAALALTRRTASLAAHRKSGSLNETVQFTPPCFGANARELNAESDAAV